MAAPAATGHDRAALLRGMLLMAAAVALFPANDAIAKYLTQDYHVVQVTWSRYFFQAAFMALLFRPRRLAAMFTTNRPGLQLLRAGMTVVSTLLFITALRFVPLAEAVSILFAAPLFLVALSQPILGESVGPHRWAAVAIGFAAVLVIVRPGLGVLHWAGLLALLAAFVVACFQIATRLLARTDPSLTTLLYMAFVGTALLSPAAAWVWTPPTAAGWALMALMGLIGGIGHYGVIKAIALAPVSALAPFTYTQIVSAALLGYVVFGNVPDRWTLLGVAVVIGCGLYVVHRERLAAPAGP